MNTHQTCKLDFDTLKTTTIPFVTMIVDPVMNQQFISKTIGVNCFTPVPVISTKYQPAEIVDNENAAESTAVKLALTLPLTSTTLTSSFDPSTDEIFRILPFTETSGVLPRITFTFWRLNIIT